MLRRRPEWLLHRAGGFGDFAEGGEGCVDVVGGVEGADAEAGGAAGIEGAEGAVGERGAVQAGANLDAVVPVEQGGQDLRVISVNGQTDHAESVLDLLGTEDVHAGNLGESFEEARGQLTLVTREGGLS